MDAAEHFAQVYRHDAEAYDELVRAEDHAGNLWTLLDQLVGWHADPTGLTVVEAGAGTGRLTAALAERARLVHACDREPAMLAVARRSLRDAAIEWHLAEHRHLPVADGVADVGIEGWAFGHYVDWEPDDWAAASDAAIAELCRTVRPGGTLVLIETLGTGVTEPEPPHSTLDALYRRFEQHHGLHREVVRTDYRFTDRATAERVVTGFFGTAMLDHLTDATQPELPECTGVWWSRLGGTRWSDRGTVAPFRTDLEEDGIS